MCTDIGQYAAQQHPDHQWQPLPKVLRQWQKAGIDCSPFWDGYTDVQDRYTTLGLAKLLPLDRFMVAHHSTRPGAFGGFHHPGQGYRHLQMMALVTVYGDMSGPLPARSELALLDLLRGYAHDCLHYGSFRRYQLRGDGTVVRTQYGINYRTAQGRTYSAPDPRGTEHTRNLGVIMEGACDREARAITRASAREHGITEPDGPDRYAYRDVTGQLDAADCTALAAGVTGQCDEHTAYLTAMDRYETGVDTATGGSSTTSAGPSPTTCTA
ncbi:hypothetical protein SALCHL_002921 [Streptomyces albus subsp. chlorinus]|uniref:hypothetical protein n=1 Tax=Streptomyces albus TaxID=1888 RepID=UPI001FAC7EAE|nr:hypothetical protein [Streptomyces albus]